MTDGGDAPPPYRRSVLVRRLAALRGFPSPDPRREQVGTPPEAAATLLEAALAREDIAGRTVLDLGSGTGVLAIGAALLGARRVTGVEAEAGAIAAARANAEATGVEVDWRLAEVERVAERAETVVMNPPFGAQTAHADRPFWDAAFASAERRIYAFALADSRSFIARRAVARGAKVEATVAVPWELPRTFRHHRKARVDLPVDLWVLAPAEIPP